MNIVDARCHAVLLVAVTVNAVNVNCEFAAHRLNATEIGFDAFVL